MTEKAFRTCDNNNTVYQSQNSPGPLVEIPETYENIDPNIQKSDIPQEFENQNLNDPNNDYPEDFEDQGLNMELIDYQQDNNDLKEFCAVDGLMEKYGNAEDINFDGLSDQRPNSPGFQTYQTAPKAPNNLMEFE